MKWVIEHINECKINDSDKCEGCLHVSEASWALSQSDTEKETETINKEPKPLVYEYRLKEWR
tara:strand:- start:667 stop:852 length:186 start_codon:yes stop_codon:yes gene_type:complete